MSLKAPSDAILDIQELNNVELFPSRRGEPEMPNTLILLKSVI